MKWLGRRTSDNVEDRRRVGGKQMAVGGGVGGIIIVLLVMLLGGNPDEVMQNLQQTGLGTTADVNQPPSQEEEQEGMFVCVILA